jgi:uncharacterized ParB-like nuclease family protein
MSLAAAVEYGEELEAGAKFPPVVVFYDGEKYWLADGYHRLAAHATAGKETIAAEVHEGTKRDAIPMRRYNHLASVWNPEDMLASCGPRHRSRR